LFLSWVLKDERKLYIYFFWVESWRMKGSLSGEKMGVGVGGKRHFKRTVLHYQRQNYERTCMKGLESWNKLKWF
jgi:hypothetical protein